MRAPDWGGAAREVIAYWEARGYASHDPYDALATRWVRRGASLPRPVRHLLVQANRRLPFNLRALQRIPRMRNAYAEAHFASASIKLWRLGGDDRDRRRAEAHLEWLGRNRVDGGWAYPFDVQTGTASYPRTTPNVICTVFAAQAYWDVWDATGDAAARAGAVDAGRFLVERLLLREPERTWFEYYPGHGTLIHNANVLAARAALQAGRLAGDEAVLAAARDAACASAAAVEEDGEIRYGERAPYLWVDGHHTGFVVEALHDLSPAAPQIADAARRAAGYYRERLFAPDGRPLQAPGRHHPVDAIAGAQGIQTFARLGDLPTARRIARWMLSNMRGSAGTFAYQRGRAHTKRVPYARWSDAPMALALATLAVAEGATPA